MTSLERLPLSELQAHPDNPRLQLRDDVVDQIAVQITESGYGDEHAILVRPWNGGYQIVAGHHRHAAAVKAGQPDIPAWVREMDDAEALMQLVLSNAQGELTPLEIGVHALTAVPLSGGGRGVTGGLSEYARQIGRAREYITRLRDAANVLQAVQTCTPGYGFSLSDLTDKAKHLYEISRADESLWPLLVRHMLDGGWSAADAEYHVKRIAEFQIPEQWRFWLPLELAARRLLETGEFSPKTVARLIAAAQQTVEWITDNGDDDLMAEFHAWLVTPEPVLDPRKIAEHMAEMVSQQFIVKGWHQGDWRDHVGALEDGSVHLLLTDPPYGQAFQSDRRTDRRQERRHDYLPGDADPDTAADELAGALEAFFPKLADDAHALVFCGWASEPLMRDVAAKAGYALRGSLIWDKQVRGMGDRDTTFAPSHERILHLVKGSPKLFSRPADVFHHARIDKGRHPTEKPVSLLRELIEATTAENQLVADPFGGVGSTLVAARESARRWWGSELDESYWRSGEERLS